jgi:hypothetical protein
MTLNLFVLIYECTCTLASIFDGLSTLEKEKETDKKNKFYQPTWPGGRETLAAATVIHPSPALTAAGSLRGSLRWRQ